MDLSKTHEAHGFSSVSAFARERLNLKAETTRALVRVGRALRDLPLVREAALRGELSFEHLLEFDYAVRVVGREETRESQDAWLAIARNVPADEMHGVLRQLREATLDELDAAWRRGMDKRDLTLQRTIDGWMIAGFLPIDLGTKLRVILDSLSVPREAGDTRRPAERRLEGLESLCDSVLEHGLPADSGVRPRLHVVIDADDDRAVAKLERFGTVGPALVAHLACHGELVRITVRNSDVLDVGHRHRFATAKQTTAIWHQQDGRCAGPGCRHAIGHVHHILPVSEGGPTDLANLVGLCAKCHALVHQGRIRPALARAG